VPLAFSSVLDEIGMVYIVWQARRVNVTRLSAFSVCGKASASLDWHATQTTISLFSLHHPFLHSTTTPFSVYVLPLQDKSIYSKLISSRKHHVVRRVSAPTQMGSPWTIQSRHALGGVIPNGTQHLQSIVNYP